MSINIGGHLWKIFDIEVTKNTLNDCISASRALAELKGTIMSLRIPDVTRNFISLSESKAAFSMIGKGFDSETVFKASVAKEGDYSEDLEKLLRYSNILNVYSAKSPALPSISEAISELTGTTAAIRTGNLGPGDLLPGDSGLSFASGPDVLPLMTQLYDYIENDNGTDELLRSVISVLFFHVICPLEKDNELAEILFLNMMLNRFGLTDGNELMVATVMNDRREEYYRTLRLTETDGHTEAWIRFMLGVVRESALITLGYIHSIQEIYEEICEECNTVQFFSKNLMDVVFSNVYCKSQTLIRAGIAERVTAMKYLRTLEELGFLKSEKIGRETIFENVPLYDYLVKH